MKIFLLTAMHIVLYCLVFRLVGHTQPPADTASTGLHQPSTGKGLFETDKVLEITLSCNFNELINDRSDDAKYHPMQVLYRDEDSSEISVPAKGKTRGNFRRQRQNCVYPPLWINFSKSEILKSSVFKGQDKLKLVMPCQGDEYIIREWLVYKLYNLVTPKSFRTRLVRVKLDNTKNKKKVSPFYAILLEGEKQMAKRNGMMAVNRKIKPWNAEEEAFLTMTVFQFLVGNTDWSVQYQHNLKLLALDSNAVCTAVPYDFDHAGIVDAPYAKPAEQLNMSSVRERRYRGYCIQEIKKFDGAITLYNKLKKDIYNIYEECPFVEAKYKKATLKYLDEFYATINNGNSVKEEFGYPCDKNGTGNVIIKGLNKEDR